MKRLGFIIFALFSYTGALAFPPCGLECQSICEQSLLETQKKSHCHSESDSPKKKPAHSQCVKAGDWAAPSETTSTPVLGPTLAPVGILALASATIEGSSLSEFPSGQDPPPTLPIYLQTQRLLN